VSDQERDLTGTGVAVTGATAGIGRATARPWSPRGRASSCSHGARSDWTNWSPSWGRIWSPRWPSPDCAAVRWEAVYAGTKHAQVGLAGSLDRELREHGIRVTTICPAAVSTEFAIGAGRNEGDAWLDDVLRPEDVAHTVLAVLRQPRRLRTQTWVLRAMSEES